MGDIAEAKYDNDDDSDDSCNSNKLPVMQRLTVSLSKAVAQTKEFQEALASARKGPNPKLVRKTLKRKTKLANIFAKSTDINNTGDYYQKWIQKRSTNLEKLHFIIGHGILQPKLRDEIFCQICKQLTNNPYHSSFAKGWILLALCVGCFTPTKTLEPYLRNFIRQGPELYAPYCEDRLNRTFLNGSRTQPPSWLELCAVRNKTLIALEITLMDGTTQKINIDSASTAKEVVEHISINLGLKDKFGFAIFITVFDKVMSLGFDHEHIMDAVSNCEQYTKEQGFNERKSPWKLFLRKEMFAPWFDPAEDEIATNIIYEQIIRGVKFGEYQCKTEKDLSVLASLHYFIDRGNKIDIKELEDKLDEYIPKELLLDGESSVQKWQHLIMAAFQESEYVKNNSPRNYAKEDIVIFAQLNWPLMFSRFVEAIKMFGPDLGTDNFVIGINSNGIYFLDQTEQCLAKFSYPEIRSITTVPTNQQDQESSINEIELSTWHGISFTVKCFEASAIKNLIDYIVNNLKSRSIYAVLIENYSNSENKLNKGELLKFDKGITGAMLLQEGVTHLKTKCKNIVCEMPIEFIHFIPILKEPDPSLLQIFKDGPINERKKYVTIKYNTIQRKKLHTLEKFAKEYFRSLIATSNSSTIRTIRNREDDLWRYTRDPIKAPLLQKLQFQKCIFQKATQIFNNILKYMSTTGSSEQNKTNIDEIFTETLLDENLRDEVYCQIMRQLTDNNNTLAEERCWDLMWLASGIMCPGTPIQKELEAFLKTRKHPLAVESLKRLRNTLKKGHRKHPPHIIEIEAIQSRVEHIYHKIYFPNDTVEAFEIESSTLAIDLCNNITKRLDIKLTDGFSLFIKIMDKAFSIPDGSFIFDFITELVNWVKETMPSRSGENMINCRYQLFFMKKLWINMTPGKDKNADSIFNFPQEVPKYLNSYYNISKEDASKLGALLYRIKFDGNGTAPSQQIQNILNKVLPEDLLALKKKEEWKKCILNDYNAVADIDVEAAKELFLNHISQYPNFGSTFFVVTQSNDATLPETILIAINHNGFNIIDPKSKEILITYTFTQLNYWSSGNTYFHIRFGNMIGASKLLCTTTQGYKMDDLLSSYIRYFKSLE